MTARNTNPTFILAHAMASMVEQLMAFIGRSHAQPRQFRTRLETMDDYELGQFYVSQFDDNQAET